MKRLDCLVFALVVSVSAGRARADVAEDLAKASTAAHPVFLVVTEADAKGTDLARRVSIEAAKIVDAVVVELDRSTSANTAVAKRYRLESVPVPLILVIASNGVAAAAAKPIAVTAGQLARMVPSPAKAAYLKALDEKKSAFLVFASETTPGRSGAVAACVAAETLLEGKAATVIVGLADDAEAVFRGEMKIVPNLPAAVTIVVNPRGQRTATFDSTPDAAALVEASKRVVEECCPGGRCK